jgi:thioredoxin-related protein
VARSPLVVALGNQQKGWLTMKRLSIGLLIALLGVALGPGAVRADDHLLPYIESDENGLHTQPWFANTFLDLREDVATAAAEGRNLVIIWEQRGCPYCREMHRVNLRIPEIVDYIKANFDVIQLNLWGDLEVVDTDGEVLTEKQLARKYRVQFTPTLQFFPMVLNETAAKAGDDEEIWRLMGYWKPFHFHNSFVYVREKGYETEPNFQRWLQARADKLRAEGKEVEIW